MKNNNITMRDFIYLDGDRLHSLYSQAFEGIAEKIIQSYVDSLSTLNRQKGEPLTGASLASQVAEISQRTENKLLHDHMYNQYEERISAGLVFADNVTRDNYMTSLRDVFAVKVSGSAEIEDFNRMTIFIEKFNEIAEAIAYSAAKIPELASSVDSISKSVSSIKDRNQRAKAKELLRQQTDPKKLAQQMGLWQDPKKLSNLKLFSVLFAPNQFFVTIVPRANKGAVVFRAILNTNWLRVQPDHLRALYGNYPESEWTLVGQITHFPSGTTAIDTSDSRTHDGQDHSTVDETPSMRDPFRSMFKASSVFEKMFLESKERVELIVFPLAVYREFKVITTNT